MLGPRLLLPALLAIAMAAAAQQEAPARAKIKERELEEVRDRISELKQSMDESAADRDRLTAELQATEIRIAEKRQRVRELELEPPNVVFEVFGEAPDDGGDGPRLAEVHLGVFRGTRGIVARSPGSDAIYELSDAVAEELPVSLPAFRNRFVAEGAEEGEPEAWRRFVPDDDPTWRPS